MNVFKQFYVSLYSPKDIATFRNQGIGKTILFMLFLTFVSILPSSYYVNVMIKDGISAISETVSTEMPSFEIKNGKLTTESDQPTILNKNGFMIFVDDSGKLTAEEVGRRATNGVALLRSEFVIVSAGVVQSSPYSLMNTNINANNQTISTWLKDSNQLLWIFLPLMTLMFYIFSVIFMFMKVFIFALFGMVFKNSLGRTLSYGQLWKMTTYCLVLPTVFFTIMDMFQAIVSFRITLSWFVIFIMLLLTIKEVPKDNID